MKKIAYRAEIDGLRAIAIIPVILFHAGVSGFQGGFVGVDVFFVISGYLITTIILKGIKEETFSFYQFYERRVRRLFPALFVVVFISYIVAFLILLPQDFKDFSNSVISVALFVSNIFFYSQADYFGKGVELTPLIHTWSLSVEEQFYIVFPVLLLAVSKFDSRAVGKLMLILFIVSFCLSVFIGSTNSKAAFFLFPFRMWELLIGGFCALLLTRWECKSLSLNQILSILGILFIVFSIILIDKYSHNVFLLFPTIGAGLLIIFSSEGTITKALLEQKLLVGIGLISYSLYLWHQPIFVFSRYMMLDEKLQYFSFISIFIIFIISYCSWLFIEQPFRRKKSINIMDRKKHFLLLLLSLLIVIWVGFFGGRGGFDVFYERNKEKMLKTLTRSSIPSCKNMEFFCNQETFSENDILLIGDSNAYHFSKSLNEIAISNKGTLINITQGGCLPLSNFYREDQKEKFNRDCIEFNKDLRDHILTNSKFKGTVILSSAWLLYLKGGDLYKSVTDKELTTIQLSKNGKVIQGDMLEEEFFQYMDLLLFQLTQYSNKVIFVGPIPPSLTNYKNRYDLSNTGELSLFSDFEKNALDFISYIKYLKTIYNFELVLPHEALCSKEFCVTSDNFGHYYGDWAHLSDYGQNKIMKPLFEELLLK